jgi:hypothetical protein
VVAQISGVKIIVAGGLAWFCLVNVASKMESFHTAAVAFYDIVLS